MGTISRATGPVPERTDSAGVARLPEERFTYGASRWSRPSRDIRRYARLVEPGDVML